MSYIAQAPPPIGDSPCPDPKALETEAGIALSYPESVPGHRDFVRTKVKTNSRTGADMK